MSLDLWDFQFGFQSLMSRKKWTKKSERRTMRYGTCLSCKYASLKSLFIVAVFQPQLQSTHRCLCVCVSVCLRVCLSVCVHDNSKNNGSIHLKLEHIVVYGNSSDQFDIGHCPIKVKVTA